MRINPMRLLAAFLLVGLASAPALAQKTKGTLNTEVTTNFPTQSAGTITPAIAVATFNDFISSWQQAPRVRANVATTDTITVNDYGFLVTEANSSPIAVTLPRATGTFATFSYYQSNFGPGTVTITPTISTINGNANYTLASGASVLIISDATNWQVFAGSGVGGGPGAFTTLSATGAVTFTGLGLGTQTSCMGLSAGNAIVLSSGSCTGLPSILAGYTICNPTGGPAVPIGCSGLTELAQLQYQATGSSTPVTLQNKLANLFTPEDFGAVADNGVTDNSTTLQLAATNIPAGGIFLVPKVGYGHATAITFSNPGVSIWCGGSALSNAAGIPNFLQTSAGGDHFHWNAIGISTSGCALNRNQAPSAGATAIAIGTDGTSVSDLTCSNGSTLVTSASPHWSAGDVGKWILLPNCGAAGGPTFDGLISVFNSSTSITISINATCGGSCPAPGTATATYGFSYEWASIQHTRIYGSNFGIHSINAAGWNINDNTVVATGNNSVAMYLENTVVPDLGSGVVSNNRTMSNDTANGYSVRLTSGGGVQFINNAIYGGKYSYFLDWKVGLSGGPTIVGGWTELCTSAGVFVSTTQPLNDLKISNLVIDCGSAGNILIDNAATNAVNTVSIEGNVLTAQGGGCIDIGKATTGAVRGNTCNMVAGGAAAFRARSNCNGILFGQNTISTTTTRYQIDGGATNCFVDDGEPFSWTPVLQSSGGPAGTWTYGPATAATSSVVGRNVLLNYVIVLTANTVAPGAGNALITGFPIASLNVQPQGQCWTGVYGGITFDAGYTQLTGNISPLSTLISLYENGSTKAVTNLPIANVAATAILEGGCNYRF